MNRFPVPAKKNPKKTKNKQKHPYSIMLPPPDHCAGEFRVMRIVPFFQQCGDVITVALQQESPGFESQPGRLVCMAFECSLHASVGVNWFLFRSMYKAELRVLLLPPIVHKHDC
ncbi:hypothetical protein AMECASPLE_006952 [Ameca splendens]|uniref:Uncharacterized protein n=1 Tax=Ameca splendens TaxID=208324 RepID=A0ABV0ZWY6_9TELE